MTILWIAFGIALVPVLLWGLVLMVDEFSGHELAAYDHTYRLVRVRFGHRFPLWFGKRGVASGMTFNGMIRFDNLKPSYDLFLHELAHIVQEREAGTFRFLWRWFTDRAAVEADAHNIAAQLRRDFGDLLEDEYDQFEDAWAAWAARRA